MRYIYLALNCFFGVLFAVLGLVSLFDSILGGLCLIAISALLLPPIRNIIYSKTNLQIPVAVRVITVFFLFSLFGIFIGNSHEKEAAEIAAQKAKENELNVAKVQQENIIYFKNNRDKIVNSVSEAISQKKYQVALSEVNKYLAAQDEELNNLYSNAKTSLYNINKAENEAKEKVQKEAERIKKQQENKRLSTALQKMTKDTDKIEGVVWYRDKSSPTYNNQNGFFLYIGKSITGGKPWLRFRVQYHAEDWLFIESFIVMADNQKFERNRLRFERDNDSKIWEWYDSTVTEADLHMIRTIIASKNSVIRFNGRQYRKDKPITSSQKQALRNVLDAYKVLGGS